MKKPGRQPDEVPHEVTVSRPFYLGRFEVTQGEWTRLMHQNPSQFPACGPRCPADTVTYDDVQDFIRRLTDAAHGGHFRLPSEAEWEYACRAGTRGPFSTGSTLTAEQANYAGRSGTRAAATGATSG